MCARVHACFTWKIDLSKIDEQSEDSCCKKSKLEKKIDSAKIYEQIEDRQIDRFTCGKLLITMLLYNIALC